MLLLALILFALCGILFLPITKNRPAFILLLSTTAIACYSPASLLYCLFIALVNYGLIKNVAQKKTLFIAGLFFNLLSLGGFHVYEYLYNEWGLVPVVFGVSYLLLQFIDYSCKVYFKQAIAPTSFIKYLAAAFYAPKFFMGPIASLPDVEKDIEAKQETKIYYGLNRILLGLFKKLVLAESLALYVSSALDFKDVYPALTILSGACMYALQLYFDFSGYCDIAIGASAIWGINLPENFNFPFSQKTWSAFWKSWHSSLTNLLWQYIFIPLYLFFGRKKTNKLLAKSVCVIAVFSFMAFFNGVKSGFFISAYLFALFYLIEMIFERKTNLLSNLFIFLLFSIAILFFRNPNYTDYSFLTARLLDFKNFLPADWLRLYFAPLASGGSLQDYFNFAFTLLLCFSFLFFEKKIFKLISINKINYALWFTFLLLLATWGVFTSTSKFIYMQF